MCQKRSKELVGVGEESDWPETTFSGDSGDFPNPKNTLRGDHTGSVSSLVTAFMHACE